MQNIKLGPSDLIVSRLCYGCMRITGTWDRTKVDQPVIDRAIKMIETAFEVGYTFFDHADIYGDTSCESVFGLALKKHPEWRKQMVIATKCGIRFEDEPTPGLPHRYDFSREHIIQSAHDSLERLGIDTLDLFYLHRPDFLADPEEIATAFQELRKSGKVRWFGVSNFRPDMLRMLQKHLPFPLICNQIEIHALRLDPFTDGSLDQCLETGITPVSWSPIAHGRLGDKYDPGTDAHLRVLQQTIDQAAQSFGIKRSEMAVAWLLRHPAKIVPIIGTTNLDRIHESVKSLNKVVDRETWYRIMLAARGQKLP